MGSAGEFAALIKLLDDTSDSVRSAVSRKLLEYEDRLPDYIAQLNPLPSPSHFSLMNKLLREAKCETLSDHWDDALTEPTPIGRLEQALGLLADYLDGRRLRTGQLTFALDELAEDLERGGHHETPFLLVRELFESGRFRGNRQDYYAPQNSNLLAVLREGMGNPISLACLLMLLADRFGYVIDGCNYPGHFLALIPREPSPVLIDCFNGGQPVSVDDLIDPSLEHIPDLRETLQTGAAPEVILLRVLRNLERAFHQLENQREKATIDHLIERMLVSGTV